MQVSAVRTPITASAMAAAIISAYRALRGQQPPAKSSWLWPLALWANETANGKSMYNWNVGNVTTAGDPATWYANPGVTAPFKFLAFNDAQSGALSMLKVLDKYGGIAAADAGDQAGWQNALNKYLGSGTYPSPWILVAKLQDTQPEGVQLVTPPVSVSRPEPGILIAVVVAATLAGATAFAAKRRRALWG